jgi:hypothetical protein
MIRHYAARRAQVIEDHPHNAAAGVMPCFPADLRQADGLPAPLRPEIPIRGGGPHDYGRPIALGPERAAPFDLLLGRHIIGVGLNEQLHEHRMHDAPFPGPAAVLIACRALDRVEDRPRPLIHSAGIVMPGMVRPRVRKHVIAVFPCICCCLARSMAVILPHAGRWCAWCRRGRGRGRWWCGRRRQQGGDLCDGPLAAPLTTASQVPPPGDHRAMSMFGLAPTPRRLSRSSPRWRADIGADQVKQPQLMTT